MFIPSAGIVFSLVAFQLFANSVPVFISLNDNKWIKCQNPDYILNFNLDENSKSLYSLELDDVLEIQSWSIGRIKGNFFEDVYSGKISTTNNTRYDALFVDIDLVVGRIKIDLRKKPTFDDVKICEAKPKGQNWQAPCKDRLVSYLIEADCIRINKEL